MIPPGGLHQLLRAIFLRPADIKVVANQKQKRGLPGKLPRALHGVTVAERRDLFDELDSAGVRPGGGAISSLIARADHDADFVNPGLKHLFHDDGQRCFCEPSRSTSVCSGKVAGSCPRR